jgi:hypothetical protein
MSKTSIPQQFYPEMRGDYSNKIGIWGELAINIVLEDYPIIPHRVNEPGVDIAIEDYDIAIEIWNHRKQHAYTERLNSVTKNLSNYEHKFHIVSFISPQFRKIEEEKGIIVIELGFQIIHPEYQSFYEKNYGMKRKKTLNKRTFKSIENKLKPVTQTIEKCRRQENIRQLKEPCTGLASVSISGHCHVCSTHNITQDFKNSITYLNNCSEKDSLRLALNQKIRLKNTELRENAENTAHTIQSPDKPYFKDCISGLNFTFGPKCYLVKLSSLSLLHTGCFSIP